jgi:hypothetical protein
VLRLELDSLVARSASVSDFRRPGTALEAWSTRKKIVCEMAAIYGLTVTQGIDRYAAHLGLASG